MPVVSGGQVQGGLDREDLRFTLRGYYTFAAVGNQAAQGGAVGAVDLVDESGHVVGIPDNFIVERATIHTLVALTSGGSATVALGTSESGKGAVILAATGFGSAPFNAIDAIASASAALPSLSTGTGNTLRATIATAALTAGRFAVTIHGYLGD